MASFWSPFLARVKVVSPLRWLHSLVTDKIAMIGRTTVSGKLIAVVNAL